MEGEPLPDAPDAPDTRISPTLQLQTTTVPEFPALSLSPSFKLDEGYSDDTRSQADKDLGSDNVMALPNWVLAQSEAGRAGKISPSLGPCGNRYEREALAAFACHFANFPC
jgi:F-box and WD-40 domain protein 1/11